MLVNWQPAITFTQTVHPKRYDCILRNVKSIWLKIKEAAIFRVKKQFHTTWNRLASIRSRDRALLQAHWPTEQEREHLRVFFCLFRKTLHAWGIETLTQGRHSPGGTYSAFPSYVSLRIQGFLLFNYGFIILRLTPSLQFPGWVILLKGACTFLMFAITARLSVCTIKTAFSS